MDVYLGEGRRHLRIEEQARSGYEVRVYFQWPEGGFNVRSRNRFTVGAARATTALGWVQKREYRTNETVIIEWAELPGAAHDWVAIVKPNDADNTHGQWWYTDGKKSGARPLAKKLAPGEYEVRVYYDWEGPTGGYVVRSRSRFTVK